MKGEEDWYIYRNKNQWWLCGLVTRGGNIRDRYELENRLYR